MNTLPRSFDEMKESKYLTKDDVQPPRLLTIKSFDRQNVARQDDEPEYKWIMYFMEEEKGMVLGSTNRELLKMALGTSSPSEALGRKIVLFNDPSVSYGGKLTGGIRLRAPRIKAPEPEPAPKHQVANAETIAELDDDIPF